MKMLQDDTEALNKLARGRTNQQMLAVGTEKGYLDDEPLRFHCFFPFQVINNENPNYREIQQENRELKACLEDYQRTIELIMTKYRQNADEKILKNKLVLPDIYNKQKDEVIGVRFK